MWVMIFKIPLLLVMWLPPLFRKELIWKEKGMLVYQWAVWSVWEEMTRPPALTYILIIIGLII